jgi:hypothetical protein
MHVSLNSQLLPNNASHTQLISIYNLNRLFNQQTTSYTNSKHQPMQFLAHQSPPSFMLTHNNTGSTKHVALSPPYDGLTQQQFVQFLDQPPP